MFEWVSALQTGEERVGGRTVQAESTACTKAQALGKMRALKCQ